MAGTYAKAIIQPYLHHTYLLNVKYPLHSKS